MFLGPVRPDGRSPARSDRGMFGTFTGTSLPPATLPFFILLNLAVGGNWPGAPDSTTVFPQTMTVDYVRVCQR